MSPALILAFVLAGLALCIVLSGWCSACEMAYSSMNHIRMENEAEEGNKKAKRALKIVAEFDKALSAILIGNNLVNIAASSLGSVAIILIFGDDSYSWLATLVITVLVIIFGETIPKICAKRDANNYALRDALPLNIITIILTPLILLTVFLIKLLTGWLKEEEESEEETVDELSSIIETAGDEGVLNPERTELLQAAIDFSEISASEVMTARIDILAIDIEDEPQEIYKVVDESPYSRLPVYEGSIDHVIGTLHLNHYLKAFTEKGEVDIRSLLMPPCFVYKTTKLPQVLSQLRSAKQHLAVVTDEYGGTMGIVSMEDVLEQIVGDIWDESDIIEEEVVEKAQGKYEIDGDMVISDFLELLELNEEEFECESETAGGLVTERLGHFPSVGEKLEIEGFTVTVVAMDGLRVEKLLVEPPKETENE